MTRRGIRTLNRRVRQFVNAFPNRRLLGKAVQIAGLSVVGMLSPTAIAFAQAPLNDFVSGGVLDQQFIDTQTFLAPFPDPYYLTNEDRAYGAVNEYQEFAQSFVAGVSGQLSHVKVNGGGSWTAETTLAIWSFSNGLPGQILGSRTLMPGSPTDRQWFTFDLRPQSIQVNAGQKFVIAMSGVFSWSASLWGGVTPIYPDGEVFWRQRKNIWGEPLANDGNWLQMTGVQLNNDFLFRTYVNPVPEPSMVAMAPIAACGFASVARQRQRRSGGRRATKVRRRGHVIPTPGCAHADVELRPGRAERPCWPKTTVDFGAEFV
jgi:hypothetical protein